jgi:hypothetical protein
MPGEKAPSTHLIGGWVSPRAGLDDMEEKKFLILLGLELNGEMRFALRNFMGKPIFQNISFIILGHIVSLCFCVSFFTMISFSDWMTDELEKIWKWSQPNQSTIAVFDCRN